MVAAWLWGCDCVRAHTQVALSMLINTLDWRNRTGEIARTLPNKFSEQIFNFMTLDK